MAWNCGLRLMIKWQRLEHDADTRLLWFHSAVPYCICEIFDSRFSKGWICSLLLQSIQFTVVIDQSPMREAFDKKYFDFLSISSANLKKNEFEIETNDTKCKV